MFHFFRDIAPLSSSSSPASLASKHHQQERVAFSAVRRFFQTPQWLLNTFTHQSDKATSSGVKIDFRKQSTATNSKRGANGSKSKHPQQKASSSSSTGGGGGFLSRLTTSFTSSNRRSNSKNNKSRQILGSS
jgi:hypothetical protein